MPTDITTLTWVIGLGGTALAVLMGVMWSYILMAQRSLYEHVTATKKELKGELDAELSKLEEQVNKQSDQSRSDGDKYDKKYALKEDFNELKGTVNSVRSEMNLQFTNMIGQMSALAGQLGQIIGIIAHKTNNPQDR